MLPFRRNGQPLQSLDLHYYATNPNFQNNLALQIVSVGLPNYSNLIISYTTHVHPIHPQFGPLPFIILNKKYYITGDRIQSFFFGVLADLLQKIQIEQQMLQFQRRRMSDVSYSALLLQFIPIYRTCQQLSMVIDQFSQKDLNDYYTLISPWKKYQYGSYLEKRRNQLDRTTYFIEPSSNKLNENYFQSKIEELKLMIRAACVKPQNIEQINDGHIVEEMRNDQLLDKCQLVIEDWAWIYTDIFLKQLKKRNEKIYEAIQKDPFFNQQKIQLLRSSQKQRRLQLFTQQRMLGQFYINNAEIQTQDIKRIQDQKKKKQEKQVAKDQYTKLLNKNQQQGFMKALIAPILINLVFWTGWKVLRAIQ